MVVAENETGDDGRDVNGVAGSGGGPKSPWKTPAALEAPADGPVMGAETWPALADAQRPKSNPDLAKQPQPQVASAPPLDANVPPPPSTAVQGSSGHQKYGSRNPSPRHPRSGAKRNPTGPAPFPVQLPYHQPVPMPHYIPGMVPPPHMGIPGYGYPPFPGPAPSVDDHLAQSGSETPVQAFAPPPPHLPLRGDPNFYMVNFPGRRPAQEPFGHWNHNWHPQRPFGPRDNVSMPSGVGPRPFARPFYGPGPGYMVGPGFAGPPSICYVPVPPQGAIRGPPPFIQYPVSPGPPVVDPETSNLRANIVKQVEYYFSDENLKDDHFLISLMDSEGWVEISSIASFKRLKKLCQNVQIILDALQASDTVEVQGNKIRRRDEWAKWIAGLANSSASNPPTAVAEPSRKSSLEHSDGNVEEDQRDSSKENAESPRDKDKSENSYSKSLVHECNTTVLANVCKESKDHSISAQGTKKSSEVAVNNLDELSNDFAKPCIFDFDEELEIECRTVETDDISSRRRMDNEDDETMVTDQDVQRLVIVTQNSLTGEGSTAGGKSSKGITNELASTINDGLIFYEQELKTKRSSRRKSNFSYENKDGNFRSFTNHAASSNLKPGESSTGNSFIDEPGSSYSRKKHGKNFQKQQPSLKQQRFFTGSVRNHGSGRSSQGFVSESPPSRSVGFYFGSTPPDSHGFSSPRSSKLSVSPHGFLSGSSPPVGSMPKSFPPFQHPSHQLLEENGFKQQKYLKYHKRCLTDRKKLGIGCSEEMNTLYRFWCYFLRANFSPSMYNEFQKFALEDTTANYNYGMECLFRFYSYGLEKEFNEELFKDFEQHVLEFYRKGNLYGLEKYWAFHHYRELRDHKEPIVKNPDLDRLLREEYRSLEDFRNKEREKKTQPEKEDFH